MIRIVPLILCALLLAPSASADERRTPAVLSAESERALALAQGGELEQAIEIWLGIVAEAPEDGAGDVHVNLAVAYKALGQLPEAWYHLDAALTLSSHEDPAVASERAALQEKLAKTHVPLQFSCAVPKTQLFLTLERNRPYLCPLRWWFPRGTEDRIFAVAPDHQATEIPIRAHEVDRDRRVVVTLDPVPPAEVPEKPAATPRVAEKPPAAPGQAWKWTLLGGGLGVVAAGAVLQVLAYEDDRALRRRWDPTTAGTEDEFNTIKSKYDRAWSRNVAPKAYGAYALYGIGGAAAATGLIFLALDWTRPPADTDVHLSPIAAPGALGLTLDLNF